MQAMVILPVTTAKATMNVLMNFCPKSDSAQASRRLAIRWGPGHISTGAVLTAVMSWLAATKAIHIGNSISTAPTARIRWVRMFRIGVRSIMSGPRQV